MIAGTASRSHTPYNVIETHWKETWYESSMQTQADSLNSTLNLSHMLKILV